MKVCPSEWKLDKLHQGLLPPDESTALDAHLAACSSCSHRTQERKNAFTQARAEPRFAGLVSQLQIAWPEQKQERTPTAQRGEKPLLLRLRWWLAGGSLVGAAALGLLLSFPNSWSKRSPTASQAHGEVHTQESLLGKSHEPIVSLLYSYPGDKKSFAARTNQVLHPGDLIQFTYQLPQDAHVMVVSLDTKGKVEKYIPFSRRDKSLLTKAGKGSWPGRSALELDDSLGEERIIVVVAAKPFSYASLKAATERAYQEAGGRLKNLRFKTSRWSVKMFTIHKRQRP